MEEEAAAAAIVTSVNSHLREQFDWQNFECAAKVLWKNWRNLPDNGENKWY